MTADDRVERLERRVDRERRAREEAEGIAERGMRDLWLANQALESRVTERTAELELSLQAANMAGQAKEAFLGELGHDLATPLHAVLGLLELIDTNAMDRDDAERLDGAISHVIQLADLLRGLVELAGAEGSVHPEEIISASPGDWLDEATNSWTRRLATAGQLLVPVNTCSHARLVLPWERMHRIVDLLLDNALVHAVAGTVRVEISHNADLATFSCAVIDGGPGLDGQQLATVLEPFVRYGDPRRLGIGLTRAARLARAAGGDVVLASDGTATVATVTLPLALG